MTKELLGCVSLSEQPSNYKVSNKIYDKTEVYLFQQGEVFEILVCKNDNKITGGTFYRYTYNDHATALRIFDEQVTAAKDGKPMVNLSHVNRNKKQINSGRNIEI